MKYLLVEVEDSKLDEAKSIIGLYKRAKTFTEYKEITLDEIDEDTFATVTVAT